MKQRSVKRRYEIDMCNGSIADKILLFALPLMASSLLQLLFNAADVVVVGKFAGKEALAAGDLFGTVESDREQYARVIFDIAAALALGKGVPEDIHLDGGKYYRCPQIALTGEK